MQGFGAPGALPSASGDEVSAFRSNERPGISCIAAFKNKLRARDKPGRAVGSLPREASYASEGRREMR